VSRVDEALRAARDLLEQEGPEAMTMRRVADRIGIRAPSLYKHVPDKAELEVRLIAQGLEEFGRALRAADATLAAQARAYRAWGLAHARLYRLMTERPLPRDRLPEGLEASAAAPLLAVLSGDENRARAVWASAHGLLALELAGRYSEGADLDAAWAVMAAAYAVD
jgi:AcrR family transcriptional regulator